MPTDASHVYPKSGLAKTIYVARAALGSVSRNELSLTSAGVAFFAMFSIFPGLAALITLLSLFADPEVVVVQLEELREFLPDDVYSILHKQVVALVSTSSGTLGWASAISILLALWSARSGVAALMQGLNAVYEVEARATWRRLLSAYVLTMALVAVGIIALLALVVAPVVLAFFPLVGTAYAVAELVRWTVAILVVFTGIGMLYRFGPNRKAQGIQAFSIGALFAIVSWAIVSNVFSYYVRYFGSYSEVYGSLGAVIAMLMWLWMSSFLILLGGAINAAVDHMTQKRMSTPEDDSVDTSEPSTSATGAGDQSVSVDEKNIA